MLEQCVVVDAIYTRAMDHALTDDERKALDTLAREVLRAAASAPDPVRALAWSEAGAACLRLATLADGGLRDGGRLVDIALGDAPFAASWKKATAPIAARAEAMLARDVERDVDRLAEELGRPSR